MEFRNVEILDDNKNLVMDLQIYDENYNMWVDE